MPGSKRVPKDDGAIGLGTLKDGRVTWDSPHSFTRELREMGDGRIMARIDFVVDKVLGSLRAMRYYRRVLNLIAKATENDPKTLHDFYRAEFLTEPVIVVNKTTGAFIEHEVTKSTTDLTPSEMWDYTEKVRQHGAEFFGVITPDPDPLWREREQGVHA